MGERRGHSRAGGEPAVAIGGSSTAGHVELRCLL